MIQANTQCKHFKVSCWNSNYTI